MAKKYSKKKIVKNTRRFRSWPGRALKICRAARNLKPGQTRENRGKSGESVKNEA
jgi:hypothetical protein